MFKFKKTLTAVAMAVGCVLSALPGVSNAGITDGNAYYLYALGGWDCEAGCMDVQWSSLDDGATLWEWGCNNTPTQTFRVDDVDGNGQWFRLVDANSDKCMTVQNDGQYNGAPLVQMTCLGAEGDPQGSQLWAIEDIGDDNVRFIGQSSGKCIDVNARGITNGTKIQIWDCNDTDAQAWWPVPVY
jgi:hypothetical protein